MDGVHFSRSFHRQVGEKGRWAERGIGCEEKTDEIEREIVDRRGGEEGYFNL